MSTPELNWEIFISDRTSRTHPTPVHQMTTSSKWMPMGQFGWPDCHLQDPTQSLNSRQMIRQILMDRMARMNNPHLHRLRIDPRGRGRRIANQGPQKNIYGNYIIPERSVYSTCDAGTGPAVSTTTRTPRLSFKYPFPFQSVGQPLPATSRPVGIPVPSRGPPALSRPQGRWYR